MVLVGLLALAALLPAAVHAQGPVPQHSDPHWSATYWSNATLSGEPVVQETTAGVDYDWGYGSPHPVVPVDRFSARWQRYLDLPAGTYRFTATSDDGLRVYVDGRAVINEWHDHPVQTYTGDVSLGAGHHWVVVEYYENTGLAVAKVSWAPVTGHDAWRGEYYANRWLSGSPALVRGDQTIDYNWEYGSPSVGIPSDSFSVRWTRTVHLQGDTYRFTTTTDDGVRLWVNNHLLIDQWRDQPFRSHSGTMYASGDVHIVMEYYENTGAAAARLTWTPADESPPRPPGEVVVDDVDLGFVKGGKASAWHLAAGGYGGSLIWTRNNDRLRDNYNWARWVPDLDAGVYEVYVHIPVYYGTTSSARYWIAHYAGYTLRRVDQGANAGRWVSLGMYRFRGSGAEYVSLADVTYEPYLSRTIAFDAVKWVPR
jgi:hypothetical protein